VPGVVNVNWNDWPCWMMPLSQTPLLLVEVWPSLSRFVHLTVEPTAIVTLGGWKE
jgi:hypothetical protein